MLLDKLIRELQVIQNKVGARPVEFSDYSPHGETLPVGKIKLINGRIILSEEDGRQPDGKLIKDPMSPTPQEARKLLQAHKKDIVLINSIDFQNKLVAYCSYGSTINHAKLANHLGAVCYEVINQVLEEPKSKEIKP